MSYFKAKMHQIRFRPPQSTLRELTVFLHGREGEEKEESGKGKEWEGGVIAVFGEGWTPLLFFICPTAL